MMKKTSALILLMMSYMQCNAQQMVAPGDDRTAGVQLRADNIDEVLAAMTLEEKASLLVGGGNETFGGSMAGNQKTLVPGAAGFTKAIDRLGIPNTVTCDGPAGVRIDATREGSTQTYYATGFPIGTCLASTWNADLVREVGRAIGNETLEYGCDVILGPGLNIHRNPLCGRNFEYYSEDPLVTGVIGTACVEGIQSQGVGVSIKHFAVNSQETDRTRVSENVSQRALREIYLRGFERVVREAAPWTVMSSYNRINGTYAMGNRDLLTTVLRDEWGYRGIVMSDWIDIRPDLPTEQEVVAGNDLLMPGYPNQVEAIVAAVRDGRLDMQSVDRNVRRMLEYIVKTPHFRHYAFSNRPDGKAHAAITRQSSTEGMVLLKNTTVTVQGKPTPALPFSDVRTVALFGVNSYDFFSGGLGSGCVNVPYVVDMVEGLKNSGIATTESLTSIYRQYVPYARTKLRVDKIPEMWFLDFGQPKLDEIEITERCIRHEEPLADAAIITIGRQAGEGMDRAIEGEFNLTPMERRMIERVSGIFHAAGKRVVVIINSGSVIETASWRDQADAILVAWQPGQEGGNAVADVLTGRQTPSGKLTMTWPISATDHPSTANFPQDAEMYSLKNDLTYNYGRIKGMDYTNHEEDIYVGYRYFDTFGKAVAYPFGFGLSYTTFGYDNMKVKRLKNDDIEVSVTIRNTGKRAGKEVAQVYVAAPRGSLEKPAKELRAFAKTRLLQPGESQTLTMTIARRDMASFDTAKSQWTVDAGRYEFLVGASIEDIRCRAVADVRAYSEAVNAALAPQKPLNTLSAEL